MALFGKSDQLPNLLKKLQNYRDLTPADIEIVLEGIAAHPEFSAEKNIWMLSHPHRGVRQCAREKALAEGSVAFADRLIREMISTDGDPRRELARLVLKMAPERARRQLGTLIHSKDKTHRETALDLIDQHEKLQDLIGYLKAALRDQEPKIRHRATRILARDVLNPTISVMFRHLIHDEDQAVRHIVIEALAQHPNADLIEPFFERLPLEELETRSAISRALKQLARRNDGKISERLLPFLADDNSSLRDVAVKLLRELPDLTAILRTFLVQSQSLAVWLRERSMESIQKISSDLTEPLTTLLRDPDPNIRVGAMLMARGSRDPRILGAVVEIVRGNSDWWIRGMAAEILGNFPEPQITELLIAQIDDPELCYSVVSVLGKHQNEAATLALVEKLSDPRAGVQGAALDALRGRGSTTVLNAIVELLRSGPDLRLREKAAETLKSMGQAAAGVLEEALDQQPDQDLGSDAYALELEMVNDTLNEA